MDACSGSGKSYYFPPRISESALGRPMDCRPRHFGSFIRNSDPGLAIRDGCSGYSRSYYFSPRSLKSALGTPWTAAPGTSPGLSLAFPCPPNSPICKKIRVSKLPQKAQQGFEPKTARCQAPSNSVSSSNRVWRLWSLFKGSSIWHFVRVDHDTIACLEPCVSTPNETAGIFLSVFLESPQSP